MICKVCTFVVWRHERIRADPTGQEERRSLVSRIRQFEALSFCLHQKGCTGFTWMRWLNVFCDDLEEEKAREIDAHREQWREALG